MTGRCLGIPCSMALNRGFLLSSAQCLKAGVYSTPKAVCGHQIQYLTSLWHPCPWMCHASPGVMLRRIHLKSQCASGNSLQDMTRLSWLLVARGTFHITCSCDIKVFSFSLVFCPDKQLFFPPSRLMHLSREIPISGDSQRRWVGS